MADFRLTSANGPWLLQCLGSPNSDYNLNVTPNGCRVGGHDTTESPFYFRGPSRPPEGAAVFLAVLPRGATDRLPPPWDGAENVLPVLRAAGA